MHAIDGRTFDDINPANGQRLAQVAACDAADGLADRIIADPVGCRARFDVMQQSLGLTTLGSLAVGSQLNVERAAKDGAEIGGHPLSGHVDCLGQLLAVRQPEPGSVIQPFWKTPFES